jgi:hypothetical protein
LAIDRSTIDDAAFEDKEEDILEVNSSIMSLYFISQCIFTQANPCLPMVGGSLHVLQLLPLLKLIAMI